MTPTAAAVSVARVVRDLMEDTYPDAPDLQGKCQISSLLIDAALRVMGYKVRRVCSFIVPPGEKTKMENIHWFVIMANHEGEKVIDVSYTQFARLRPGVTLPKVVCVPVEQAVKDLWYDMEDAVTCGYDLLDIPFALMAEMMARLGAVMIDEGESRCSQCGRLRNDPNCPHKE